MLIIGLMHMPEENDTGGFYFHSYLLYINRQNFPIKIWAAHKRMAFKGVLILMFAQSFE
jgi:hypothetical protein